MCGKWERDHCGTKCDDIIALFSTSFPCDSRKKHGKNFDFFNPKLNDGKVNFNIFFHVIKVLDVKNE